jgi:hypothetical protein
MAGKTARWASPLTVSLTDDDEILLTTDVGPNVVLTIAAAGPLVGALFTATLAANMRKVSRSLAEALTPKDDDTDA